MAEPEDGSATAAPEADAPAPEAEAAAPAGTVEPATVPESPPAALLESQASAAGAGSPPGSRLSQASRSRVEAPREAKEMKGLLKTLKVGEQAQFEYALMDEIVKLQEALEMNQVHTKAEKAEIQAKVDKKAAAKAGSAEARERMEAMEAALVGAQAGELARIERRRKEGEERMAAREKESERVRKLEARKKGPSPRPSPTLTPTLTPKPNPKPNPKQVTRRAGRYPPR